MKNKTLIGIFEEEENLLTACTKIREKGVSIRDVYMPYPVHGIEKAAGFKSSRLPIAALIFGVIGLACTLAFVYWTSAISYPLRYGGKPYFGIPPFIIIGFLMTINIASFLSVATFLYRTKLYPGKESNIIDYRVTDDLFAVVIDKSPDISSDSFKEVESIFKMNGAIEIRKEGEGKKEKKEKK